MLDLLPAEFDTIVVGAGPSGCALAGRLAARSDRLVALIEAGSDYGGGTTSWPPDLLNAADLAESHSWGYDSAQQYADRVIQFDRARVIGGCSAHNGCAAIWGSHLDYDGWAALGNDGWSTTELMPYFEQASAQMRVRIPDAEEITPLQSILLSGAPGAGIPIVENLNDLYQDIGMAASPANIVDGVRWNAAFAYLDPVRELSNLTVIGNAIVERVEVLAGYVVGLRAIVNGEPWFVRSTQIILCAGTYGSPAILMRSGIGDGDDLRRLGVDVRHEIRGVGWNLHDHPNVDLVFSGTPELIERMEQFQKDRFMPEEQTIAKARSSLCQEGFDIHVYPVASPYSGKWKFEAPVACMTPLSRGRLTLPSTGPEAKPTLEHRYLSDPEGHDRQVLLDAIHLAREIIANAPEGHLLGDEIAPGPCVVDTALGDWVNANVAHYYHPVGTCKMGTANDPLSVVNNRGRVHGIDGLFVADCSIMPVIPRANTNIPAAVVGERIAAFLTEPLLRWQHLLEAGETLDADA